MPKPESPKNAALPAGCSGAESDLGELAALFAAQSGGGLSAEVIADDEMRELLLPGVVADFRLAVGYRYQASEPLDVPATLVVGRDDPHVGPAQIEPWGLEFTTPPDLHLVDGGHFYFGQDPAVITSILAGIIQADQHVELI